MVSLQEPDLDRVFGALADPTRRAMLAQLSSRRTLSVGELAQPFDMTLPAVMKHLNVLSDAGLVTRKKVGRTVNCTLAAGPMETAMDWLRRYEAFWTASLDRLTAYVEKDPT